MKNTEFYLRQANSRIYQLELALTANKKIVIDLENKISNLNTQIANLNAQISSISNLNKKKKQEIEIEKEKEPTSDNS